MLQPHFSSIENANITREKKDERLTFYLNIFEVVDHSTENPWLDTTHNYTGETYSWDEKTVEFLIICYKKVQTIIKKTELLDELIEANPKETLIELISLWNTGRISPKTKMSGRQSAISRGHEKPINNR